jgi:phosphate uptake regulator
MPSGTRTHFKKALTQLLEDVLNLGSQARRAVARAVQTLMEGDPDLAREVVAADAGINRLRFDNVMGS